MRLPVHTNSSSELMKLITEEVVGDYVYMYPPRQTYRRFGDTDISPLIASSLEGLDSVNLYFHFPFCRQICAFCNLFSTVSEDQDLLESYIGYLEREVMYYAPWLQGKKFNTLYLGGGTPSLLSPELFDRLFRFLSDQIGCNVHEISEVAIEVAPDTVNKEKLAAFREVGINRINLGVQSVANEELHLIGRRYNADIPFQALEIAQGIGFTNICVDLIYGLEGQSLESWRSSVDEVINRGPETICAYPLTLRPVTGFNSKGYRDLSRKEQYAKYDYARDRMAEAGYRQETHVRYIRDERGGYRQKMNHWHLENILGFGAGARSYLWHCDFRNGYSVRHRNKAFKEYLERMDNLGYAWVDGFIMDDDERRRKAVILGLINLSEPWFHQTFGVTPDQAFPEEFKTLFELKLLVKEGSSFKLTDLGIRHRDIIVQIFFSERVRRLLESFDYVE